MSSNSMFKRSMKRLKEKEREVDLKVGRTNLKWMKKLTAKPTSMKLFLKESIWKNILIKYVAPNALRDRINVYICKAN